VKHAGKEQAVPLAEKNGEQRAGNREGSRNDAKNQAGNHGFQGGHGSRLFIRVIREICGQKPGDIRRSFTPEFPRLDRVNREGSRSDANRVENRSSLRDHRSKKFIRGSLEIRGQTPAFFRGATRITRGFPDAELSPVAA
jgi:hypothetical protein